MSKKTKWWTAHRNQEIFEKAEGKIADYNKSRSRRLRNFHRKKVYKNGGQL